MRGDGGRGGVHGGVEHIYLDETHEVNRSSGSRRSSSTYDRARSSSQQNSQSTPASSADQNLLGGNHDSDDDSTPRGLRQESSRSGSSAASASPFDSTDGGGGISGAGVGDMAGTGGSRSSSGASGTGGGGAVRALPEVGTRPATVGNVPFGASALSKTRSNNGRGRPRGLRPRGNSSRSFSSVDGGSASGGGRMNSARTFSSRGSDRQEEREAIALAVAEEVAPGVSMEEVVQAAVKIQSVVRVLIARGYVRRKLVSEVTAFSLIMERGIEVIKVNDVFFLVCRLILRETMVAQTPVCVDFITMLRAFARLMLGVVYSYSTVADVHHPVPYRLILFCCSVSTFYYTLYTLALGEERPYFW